MISHCVFLICSIYFIDLKSNLKTEVSFRRQHFPLFCRICSTNRWTIFVPLTCSIPYYNHVSAFTKKTGSNLTVFLCIRGTRFYNRIPICIVTKIKHNIKFKLGDRKLITVMDLHKAPVPVQPSLSLE